MIRILKPGPMLTLQDAGRFGLRHLGVGCAGAMDDLALALANRLVGNGDDAAVLEITLPPATLEFNQDAVAALTGADAPALLDGCPIRPGWRFVARAGQVLQLQAPRSGMRSYLAVRGGFDVAPVLGSCSTGLNARLGGWHGRTLRAGEHIPVYHVEQPVPQYLPKCGVALPIYGAGADLYQIRATAGPELEQFSSAAQQDFWATRWKISPNSNRMGYRLQGPQLVRDVATDMRSHGVLPGLIQVPPDGQPIVLMADAQATGGYPRMGVVIAADLWKLAQIPLGRSLQFCQVSVQEARSAWHQRTHMLHQIAARLKDMEAQSA